ncbi:MAG: hypothetical protein ACI8UO_005622 [Verrucomicrobiales bacterium]|jgi:hypothetical protein
MLNLLPSRPGRGLAMQRRNFLAAASAGAAGLSLPQILQANTASQTGQAFDGSAKNCIYIFLCGGPSQLDMWDPKPEAPSGIRSAFQPISTNVPGIQLTDLLPKTAKHADKMAIIRSMHHDNASHDVGIARTLLSMANPPTKKTSPPERQDPPAVGGALSYLLGSPGELPAWVTLPRHFTTGPRFFKGQTAGFLGPEFDSFTPDEAKIDSLAAKEFAVNSLQPADGLTLERLRSRQQLLDRMDGLAGDWLESPAILPAREHHEKAFEMLTSDQAKRAFDLTAESPKLRDAYGRNEYGQSFLMARRLVESGVRMVNVFWTFYGEDGCQFNLWDNHGIDGLVCGGYSKGIDMITAPYCAPAFDLAYSALLEDLHQRGLLDDTMVVVLGEFGRTPKINKTAGRDHWPNCYSVVLAGGGVRGGQVYGKSDAHAAYVDEKPVTPDDLGATMFHAFGIPPSTTIPDQADRPVPLTKGGPITELFG